MNRGDIYWAELKPRSGSEQTGNRPVIVLSHNAFNKNSSWRSVIVVPVSTSPTQAKRGPTAIELSKGIGGLKKNSIALCHQITTLDRSKLTKFIGSLPNENLSKVEEGIKAALDLE